MDVIVVNPLATRLRKNRRIRRQIHELFEDRAIIIDEDATRQVITVLDGLATRETIKRIFVVGGDGTFNDILNWIVHQPVDQQPAMMSVGGGQFCYMARYHGFSSSNPVKNLKGLFDGRLTTTIQMWRPLALHNICSGETFCAALVANGVVSDVQRWYQSVGKGGLFTVLRIICLAGLSVSSEWLRRVIGRIKGASGTVSLDGKREGYTFYAGVVMSAIPELMSSCRPFHGKLIDRKFYTLTYWGGLKRLVCAAPFLWFGRTPFWIKDVIQNHPVLRAEFTTNDDELLVDGDLHRLVVNIREKKNPRHQVRIRAGPCLPLLMVTR